MSGGHVGVGQVVLQSIEIRVEQADAVLHTVTLVVPVYDECENIVPFMSEVSALVKLPYCAIIVYDRDEDTTLVHRERLSRQYPNIRFVKNRYGPGVINAFRTGFEEGTTEFIVPIMADLSDMPETINRLYAEIHKGYDLVVASRYMPGGRKEGGPWLKYILSKAANLSLYWLGVSSIHDMTNAFIMYRKTVLDEVCITSTGGFEITMEIIAKSIVLGFKIGEVPTVNRDRQAGKTNFQLMAWVVKYLYWYAYIVRFVVLKRLMRPYTKDVSNKRRIGY
jgi:dolichol-phosphate mannosyltransferase